MSDDNITGQIKFLQKNHLIFSPVGGNDPGIQKYIPFSTMDKPKRIKIRPIIFFNI